MPPFIFATSASRIGWISRSKFSDVADAELLRVRALDLRVVLVPDVDATALHFLHPRLDGIAGTHALVDVVVERPASDLEAGRPAPAPIPSPATDRRWTAANPTCSAPRRSTAHGSRSRCHAPAHWLPSVVPSPPQSGSAARWSARSRPPSGGTGRRTARPHRGGRISALITSFSSLRFAHQRDHAGDVVGDFGRCDIDAFGELAHLIGDDRNRGQPRRRGAASIAAFSASRLVWSASP